MDPTPRPPKFIASLLDGKPGVEAVAARLGLSWWNVHCWIDGKRPIPLRKMGALADAVNEVSGVQPSVTAYEIQFGRVVLSPRVEGVLAAHGVEHAESFRRVVADVVDVVEG